jgi:DNA processing protein
VESPSYLPREQFEALRAPRPLDAAFEALWSTGSLEGLCRPTVAVVGTRAATPYGRRLARSFGRDLAAAGCCVISGLAVGIDTAAHEGALEGGGPTIGVLGGGHACFFPSRNAALAERMIAAGGAVLSPYPPHQIAQPFQFLQRNGIVAVLADAVVVIEAPARSGALNTASWAAGRVPVLAVPGDVDRRHIQGCLALIRDGATLARSAADVLEAIGIRVESAAPARRDAVKGRLPRAILARLRQGECAVDELIDATGAPSNEILVQLALLELGGRAEPRGGGRYGCVQE